MEAIFCINCGFYGSIDTRNFCSKCYEEYMKTEIISKTMCSMRGVDESGNGKVSEEDEAWLAWTAKMKAWRALEEKGKALSVKNRCKCCKKKVGLTGFKCRCGDLFCGRHRMPEQHSCDSDYKKYNPNDAAGDPRLPLIVADKLKTRI